MIVDAAMFDATMVPAWMTADASNLNGCHAAPSHWLISPVPESIQMSSVSGFDGALAAMVVRFPPRVLTVIALVQHRRGDRARSAAGRRGRPAPGAVEVTAPEPGSCAVCTVPAENPVS